MTQPIRDAVQELLNKKFTDKDRAELLEVLLHRMIGNVGGHLTLTLDEALSLDTRARVTISVGDDLTVQVIPTTDDQPTPTSRRKVEAA